MTELSAEDRERLANRMAMLVSEDGEAANAGRAVGQLARRLGLTGGDLKAMFLESGGQAPAGDVLRLQQENQALRQNLKLLESAARRIQEEHDRLVAENGSMRVERYRRRGSRRLYLILAAGLAAVMLVVAGGVALYGPDLGGAPRGQAEPAGRPGFAGGVAVVRGPHAMLFRDPDRSGPLLAALPQGAHLTVRRLLWNMMIQWAEVESNGRIGYVATTEVELF
ncbi:MAG TPA: hypothetical protein VGC80_15450 [Acetobacteraceae bacterium]